MPDQSHVFLRHSWISPYKLRHRQAVSGFFFFLDACCVSPFEMREQRVSPALASSPVRGCSLKLQKQVGDNKITFFLKTHKVSTKRHEVCCHCSLKGRNGSPQRIVPSPERTLSPDALEFRNYQSWGQWQIICIYIKICTNCSVLSKTPSSPFSKHVNVVTSYKTPSKINAILLKPVT